MRWIMATLSLRWQEVHHLGCMRLAVRANMVAELGCIRKMLIKEDGITQPESMPRWAKGPHSELLQIDSSGLDTDERRRGRQPVLPDRVRLWRKGGLVSSQQAKGCGSGRDLSRDSCCGQKNISHLKTRKVLSASVALEREQ